MIVFSLVIYNNIEDFLDFYHFHSKEISNGCYKLIITDNSHEKYKVSNSKAIQGLNSDKIHYLYSGRNLGYFGGARENLKQAGILGWSFRWFVHCNTDINIDGTFFEAINRIDNNNFVYTPSIISTRSGRNQNPLYKIKPTSKRIKSLIFLTRYSFVFNLFRFAKILYFGVLKFLSYAPVEPEVEASECLVYACHGSFICVGKAAIDSGISFKHESFLFCEEISFAEECIEYGVDILFCPKSVVYHREHVSTGGNWRSDLLCKYHHDSLKDALRRYF